MKTAAFFVALAYAQEGKWSDSRVESDEYDGEVLASQLSRTGANKIPGSRKGGRKRMINAMAVRNFWDFEQYGCWCLEKKGYGPAVDEIDFACFAHSKCWGCAKAEHGDECDGLETPYKWKFIKDEKTNVALDIACLDTDPCRKSVCECDRKLAMDLRNMEAVYAEKYRDQSLKQEQCPRKESSSIARSSVGDSGELKLDSCCGDEHYKFPFASNSGRRACCGNRTYDTQVMECCDNQHSTIKFIGSC